MVENNKKSFWSDVGKLVSGTVIAQAVTLCLTPVISRIFSPEIYGVAAAFTSIVCVIAILMGVCYVVWVISKNNLARSYLFGF